MIFVPVVLLLLSGCHATTGHYNTTYYSNGYHNAPNIYTSDRNQRGFVTGDYSRNTHYDNHGHFVPEYKYNERYDLNWGQRTPKFGRGNNYGNTCKTRGTC